MPLLLFENRMNSLILGLMILVTPALSFALSPLTQYNDLVAGEGMAGYEDGPFYSAQFNKPTGVALNGDGSLLYIADYGNNRIRAVDLNNKNNVQTIAGTGEMGYKDGSLSTAMFRAPKCLAFLPGNRLALSEGIFEGDSSRIRLIDLNTKIVSTIAGGGSLDVDGAGLKTRLNTIWSLVYSPTDNCLYFSEPEVGKLKRLNLKTGMIKTILQGNPLLAKPAALFISEVGMYIADKDSGKIFGMAVTNLSKEDAKGNSTMPINLIWGGGHKIVALGGFNNRLYAYDSEPVSQSSPIFRIFPDPGALSFGSVWGDVISQPSYILPHFAGVVALNGTVQIGFIADPRSEGRFYITNPSNATVASFRDLNFGDLKSNGMTTQFTYPKKKPFRTYRILLCGRSFLFYQDDRQKNNWNGDGTTNIMMLMSTKLELYLNTLAALEDIPVHFEVFNHGMVIDSMGYVWPYYEEPKTVKDYDIDLVMVMIDGDQNPVQQFLFAPMTSEGIPKEYIDPEYNLKPEKEKFKSGPIRDLIDLFEKKKKKGKITGSWMENLYLDPQLRDILAGATGRPMALLKKKFDASKTSWGMPCQLCLCYFPQASFVNFPSKPARVFWQEVAAKDRISFLDMTDDFQALRYTYYPFSGLIGEDHFGKDGHTFMAEILAYELIKKKMIPFKMLNSQ